MRAGDMKSRFPWHPCLVVSARATRLLVPSISVDTHRFLSELPAQLGVPLSRLSCADLAREVCRSGIVATISGKTIWRWLHEDAIRPWRHRCWIFPRDPGFAAKAGRILDLYARGLGGRAAAAW